MKERNILLLLSQSLIGTGFFFLYVHHVRSIFESRTNIAHLTQLERESLLRREDALYFSFYKTLTEEPDFWRGYEKLRNYTGIEYPRNVNVLQRFHILPELTIAYLYQKVRRYAIGGHIPILGCWRPSDVIIASEGHIRCDAFSQPMQFYLEFVWLLGGLTIFTIYMYGMLLSENVFGGIYAVASYIMFHSYASKIYERPMARENFAFPIIFLQIFYLCLSIDRVTLRREHTSRILMTLRLTVVTTLALLCWQFSSIIFATQVLIMMTPWTLSSVPVAVSSLFAIDYAISQFLANIIAYYLSFGGKRYIFSWQIGPTIGLICVSIVRRVKQQTRNSEFSIKTIALGIMTAISTQGTIIDMLEKSGLARSVDNTFALYRDLIVHWGLQAKVNFTTSLAACNPGYARMDVTDLWGLIKTLIVKPYCMYGVVMLAKFFRKWRKSGEKKTLSREYVERAKNYVLEDFLEEYRISMRDITNKETEQELSKHLALLEKCDFSYERYKIEKTKLKKDQPNDHLEFMNDIKRLKEQIHKINDRKNKDRQTAAAGGAGAGESGAERTEAGEETNEEMSATTQKTKLSTDQHDEEEDEPLLKHATGAAANDPDTAMPSNSRSKDKEYNKKSSNKSNFDDGMNINGSNSKTHAKAHTRRSNSQKSNAGSSAAAASGAATDPPGAPKSTTATADSASNACDLLSFHYLYSFVQMAVFTVIGLSIKKLFFLSFTQGCVIAPTICSKFWYRKQRNIFWTVSLAVFLTSMFEPGIVNIREEYFPARYSYANDDLDTMLEWIKLNTERDAVFAGPIDIIGTVHLTTKRPIVNHAHLEMRHISDRTEHVYSVFSRQQSSDIYNQCSQLKIQYLIISLHECTNEISDDCDILSLWDDMQPAYRKYPQFCSELATRNIPSFLKVFSNEYYGIIKMFSQSVQINLKYSKMPEKAM